jgi:hypothetical protein
MHILSGFRHNSSQKTSKRCVSHVFEHISIIHLISSSKNKSKNCFCVSWKVGLDEDSHIATWVLYVAILIRHKKQFSDLFLDLDNEWMIEICSNTCDTHLLLVFYWNCAENHSKYAVEQTDFVVFFSIVIIGYLFLWKTFETFDMVWVFA